MLETTRSDAKNSKGKIGICTLYRAYNHGAFLQAYALKKYLQEQGYSVAFVNIYDLKHTLRAIKSIRLQRDSLLNSAAFSLRKFLVFRRVQKLLSECEELDIFDSIILGSDEIWNVKNGTFVSRNEFFGLGLNSRNILSYGPSAGKTTPEDIAKRPNVSRGLGRINSLSGRDQNALNIISEFTGRIGERVVDPVFLTDVEDICVDIGLDRFIAVYSYNFPKEYRNEVIDFSRSKGLPLVSLGFYASWCDKSVNVDPFQFLNILNRADYVVTDTFHGAVLSVKLAKNFAVYSGNKEKILDFVGFFGFEERVVIEGRTIDGVLSKGVSSGERRVIENYISKSKDFLLDALSV